MRCPTESVHQFERRRTPFRRKPDSDSIEAGHFGELVGTASALVGGVSGFVGPLSGFVGLASCLAGDVTRMPVEMS